MPPLEPIERIVGATVLVAAGLILAVVIVLAIALCLIRFTPRLHTGRPKNPVEWHTYDSREILTAKDGTCREQTGRGALVQQLNLLWWIGLSSRNRAKWFFGFMRWEESK